MFFDFVRVSHLKIQYNMSSTLFTTLQIKKILNLKPIAIAPMCQYIQLWMVNDWHLVHFSRAIGGVGLIIQTTAVSPEGRISPEDLGLCEQIENCNKLINSSAVKTQFRIQLAHGRKASVLAP
jgi:2,4-dienoyl-CoA reductase-like NADH-dependent reductase (Old Yellow Enzyme family)